MSITTRPEFGPESQNNSMSQDMGRHLRPRHKISDTTSQSYPANQTTSDDLNDKHMKKKCNKGIIEEFLSHLGENADAALHGDLGEEEVVGEEALLESAELQQPPEHGRLLQFREPPHDLPGHAARLHGRGEVCGQALELPPQLCQHEQRLLPVERRIVIPVPVGAAVIALAASTAAATGRGEVVTATAARGGEREEREVGAGEAEGGKVEREGAREVEPRVEQRAGEGLEVDGGERGGEGRGEGDVPRERHGGGRWDLRGVDQSAAEEPNEAAPARFRRLCKYVFI
jgi:hypothetical protein